MMKRITVLLLVLIPFITGAQKSGESDTLFSYQKHDYGRGEIPIELPETYELANIIWLLSPAGRQTHDIPRRGKYYEEVQTYFDAFVGHPIFQQLDMSDSLLVDAYYSFRDHSFAYHFEGEKLIGDPRYSEAINHVPNSSDDYFVRLLPLVEDFARVSKFRSFYSAHTEYYQSLISRQTESRSLYWMRLWVDGQFPGEKFQYYKVIFSPLIGEASLRTTSFHIQEGKTNLTEMVLFIPGPEIYDDRLELSQEQRLGLLTAAVCLEISRNFVATVSQTYSEEIKKAMKWMDLWVPSKSSPWRKKPVEVFNEYLAHAVVCLWVEVNYPEDSGKFLIDEQHYLMIKKRGFKKFKQFSDALRELSVSNPTHPTSLLYPQLISWCGRQ